jgi:hypothetical protein
MWGDMFCGDCEGMRAEHGGRFPDPDDPLKKQAHFDRGKVVPPYKRVKKTCSLCNTEGHNKRTCPTK